MTKYEGLDSVQKGDPITAEWANSLIDKLNNLYNLEGDGSLNQVGGAFLDIARSIDLPSNISMCNRPQVDTQYTEWQHDPKPFEVCYLAQGFKREAFVAEPPTEYDADRLGIVVGSLKMDPVPVVTEGLGVVIHNDSSFGSLSSGSWANNVVPDEPIWDVSSNDSWAKSEVMEDPLGPIYIIGALTTEKDSLGASIASDYHSNYQPYLAYIHLDRDTDNTTLAYNGSGEDAPDRSIVEIASRNYTDSQIETEKPGNGVGSYGISLQTISNGSMGRIALDSGPWEVDYSGGSPGDTIGPVDGQWTPGEGSLLSIIRGSIDGTARVSFSHGGSLSPAEFIFDGAGSAITSGAEAWLRMPYSGTLTAWTLLCEPSGSITIDIWKDTYANWPPTDSDSITNGHEPSVSSGTKAEDTDITDWSDTSVSAGDILYAHVDSVTDIERAWLMLEVQ